MKNNGEKPEFKDEYVAAFMSLLLFKNGGIQEITVEHLEKFPKKETPIYQYDSNNKSFVFMTAKYFHKKKRKRGIIKPSRKLIVPN